MGMADMVGYNGYNKWILLLGHIIVVVAHCRVPCKNIIVVTITSVAAAAVVVVVVVENDSYEYNHLNIL